MAKLLACMDVTDVDFDRRGANAGYRVPDCDAVMAQGSWIDDDSVHLWTVHLDRVDKLTFVVRLKCNDRSRWIGRCRLEFQTSDDILERRRSINPGFARAQQVQVRPVEYQIATFSHLRSILAYRSPAIRNSTNVRADTIRRIAFVRNESTNKDVHGLEILFATGKPRRGVADFDG